MSSSSTTHDDARLDARLRPVQTWLYVLAFMVIIMVAIGGITRLTDSGLSITSWKPITGAIPPLSLKDWQTEFDAYKQIPEFAQQNAWMQLADFQFIFWWEWAHRFWGRIIGLVFFVPFVVFLVQKRLHKGLAWPLGILFILGGFQGFLGWWMVSSGLSERVDVSQYRLAAHLGAACLLFAALIYVARRLNPVTVANTGQGTQSVSAKWQWAIAGLILFLIIQVIAGAFVAGLDAGFGYNTWPLMDGALVPEGLFTLSPAWLNWFENTLTVQFGHRMIAYAITAYVAWLAYVSAKSMGWGGVHGWMPAISVLVVLQVVLGITTLLLVIPMPLALGHQALAFMLVGSATAYLADMRNAA